MKPVTPEPRPEASAIVLAEDQPEYEPLPANYRYPYVETKWQLTWKERWMMFWRGTFYLRLMTFGKPLQPIGMSTEREGTLDSYPGEPAQGLGWIKTPQVVQTGEALKVEQL